MRKVERRACRSCGDFGGDPKRASQARIHSRNRNDAIGEGKTGWITATSGMGGFTFC